jgi:NAD(P)-dependent dehydrogenase (short-subunit alcohol dehydrogenase family)
MDASRSSLSGKVALVTGASRGIGRATARALAEAGAHVMVSARHMTACTGTVEELQSDGFSVSSVVLDVADYRCAEAAAARIAERHGGLDILVNNAGVLGPLAKIAESDPAVWAETIAINLVGVFNVCRAFLPQMHSGGVIVNVSSSAADGPVEAMSAYCASKAALTMLTQSLARECEPAGIRVYGFRPGRVDTDMHSRLRAAHANALANIDRSTLASVERPAAAIALLCTAFGSQFSGKETNLTEVDFMSRKGPSI